MPHRRVEAEVSDVKNAAKDAPWPAKQRAQPRGQLLHGEGFEKVVVGSSIEARYAIFDGVTRRQDKHRGYAIRAPQVTQDIQAIAVRQTQIQDDGVVGEIFFRSKAVLRRAECVDPETESREPFDNRVGQTLVIFDKQNSHLVE